MDGHTVLFKVRTITIAEICFEILLPGFVSMKGKGLSGYGLIYNKEFEI